MKIEFEASPLGKVLLLAMGGSILGFAGAIVESAGLIVAAAILVGAAFVALWAMKPGCTGTVKWNSTEDGEIKVGTCQSCDRWLIEIRDQIAAHGRGFPAFQNAVEHLASTHQSYLPHLAARLRKLLDTLEGERKPEDGFELERDG